MKIFTIENCWDCPAYHKSRNSIEWKGEYGRCSRIEGLEVMAYHEPPQLCPLKDWEEKR